MPQGWTNDPSRLQFVAEIFPADDYILQRLLQVVLASDSKQGVSQYLISVYKNLFFWTPGSDDLLYVTELYSLNRILRCMNSDFPGLQTKPLKPLSHHSPQIKHSIIHFGFAKCLKAGHKSSLNSSTSRRYFQAATCMVYRFVVRFW